MFVWSSIAHLIALTSPGPDTVVIIRQASLYGRNAGIFTALGIGVGIYIHCFLAINGISLFILENDLYKFFISIIGSCYIFYLGIAMLKTNSEIDNDKNNSTPLYMIYVYHLIILDSSYNNQIALIHRWNMNELIVYVAACILYMTL